MSDTKGSDGKGGKTLGLRGGGTEKSHVRQSFSHGRSKSVVVETKRKRVIVPKPGASRAGTSGDGRTASPKPAGVSDAELDRRRKALEAAKANESVRQQREAEENKTPEY